MVTGILVAVILSTGPVPDLEAPGTETTFQTVLALPATPQLAPAFWAIDSGNVVLPPNIVLHRWENTSRMRAMISNGSVDTGIFGLDKLPQIATANPDLLLNGYTVHPGSTSIGLYARSGTEIENLPDLEGRRVGATGAVYPFLLRIILAEEDVDNVTIIDTNQLSATNALFEQGDVDAALLPRDQGNGEAVMYPVQYWEQREGGQLPVTVWFSDGPRHLEAGRTAAQLFGDALRIGYENLAQVHRVYRGSEDWGTELTGYQNTSVRRITEEDAATLQATLDAAYEHGYIERRIDVNALMAER